MSTVEDHEGTSGSAAGRAADRVPLLHPALRRLLVLKLRGRVRAGLRRLRTPKGLLFGLVGGSFFVLWVVSLVLRLREGAPATTVDPVPVAALAITAYLAFALTANLSWRGLYLPRAEIERLFSAPVGRRELVRYRLIGTFVPTTFVALLVGAVTAARVPDPYAGFFGGVLVVALSTIVGQGAALFAAREEGPLARLLARLPANVPRLLGALGLAAVLLVLLFADEPLHTLDHEHGSFVVERDGRRFTVSRDAEDQIGIGTPPDEVTPPPALAGRFAEVASHPVVRVLTAPALPFAHAAAAPTFTAAAPWLALSLLLVVLLFEAVARLPVDYREVSLSTSQEVERRLQRLRRGRTGAAASDARVLVGWRVPWLFGQSPVGAVLWLQLTALVRRGRSALLLTAVMTCIGIVVGVWLLPDSTSGTVALVMLAIAYLASGLRFDFRSEIDRMERVRAWPLGPRVVFTAMITPVSLAVSLAVWTMLGVRAIVIGELPLEVQLALVATPLATFAWVALDNAVFLLFPVRFVPGQGGALQHSGRALVMVAVRLVSIAVVAVLAGVAAFAGAALGEILHLGPAVVAGLGASCALAVLVAAVFALIVFGAFALTRFDPSASLGES
jgi:hypothetical protein